MGMARQRERQGLIVRRLKYQLTQQARQHPGCDALQIRVGSASLVELLLGCLRMTPQLTQQGTGLCTGVHGPDRSGNGFG